MTIALITTCYREAASIEAFLDAILTQTRKPDEIIIADAGSDDGTIALIETRIAAGAPLRLIVEPGCNRSRGRNRAIAESTAETIAVTDVGALPRADWLATITAPLERDADADVVAGYYVTNPRTTWEAAVAAATVPGVSEVSPDTFLPSARSIAFRRTAWERVGGYPEWARHNEDTPFDLALKASGARFVFEPKALVEWRPQGGARRLFVQFSRYARGDAQGRIWFRHYAKAYLVAGFALGLIAAGTAWRPALIALAAFVALYWARHCLRARRRTPSLPAALLAPVANVVVDMAHVAGYSRGWRERGTHGA